MDQEKERQLTMLQEIYDNWTPPTPAFKAHHEGVPEGMVPYISSSGCQNGGDAMNIFPRLQQLEQSLPKQGMLSQDGKLSMVDSLMPLSEQIRILEKINASRQALLNYCKLDTWAMVKGGRN